MNNVERTMDLLSNGMNCSQAILTAFGEPYGLDMGLLASLGRPLAGGMGRSGRTCGAVSAAAIVLGLAKDHPAEIEARQDTFAHVRQLLKRFEALHGSTECRDLLGADWTTEEGLKKIREENLVKNRCPAFVRDAATILEELMASTCSPPAEAAACCSCRESAA